ncbi:di-heme oxidoredictase family protein [Phaeovulum vinaykumarii]|uniref:CxxC motif-containing protein, DUF1111 family n=1 Tax=Phaeovulum vinaykumarii TaxID=407234 RepID=A0A1N7L0P5_9RHOB|nr:di-heme oxidoredictase family protein [Phaeovulum vinaykumarii]SIS67377.1 CxxC motif-containing protein, DUF1111 family [Phaeovulum vinaykumarii]SOC00736.1 CxxC motif-containing protein [Phaeovulum vinaykumarii]
MTGNGKRAPRGSRRLSGLLVAGLVLCAGGAAADGLERLAGKALFDKIWVSAPASTRASDGLGPLYNARSCAACHAGPAHGASLGASLGASPDTSPDAASGLSEVVRVLHLWQPDGAGIRPDPAWGHQLQRFAAPGLHAEPDPALTHETRIMTLADGTAVPLRRPVPAALPGADPQTIVSPRIAPRLVGLGPLDRLPETVLDALADPEDVDGDGISGRRGQARDAAGRVVPGRFGHRAEAATLADQIAIAFARDIGISTPLQPAPWGDCTPAQAACRTAPHGLAAPRGAAAPRTPFELDGPGLDLVTDYTAGLRAPPGPADPRGAALFAQLGCAACHRPTLGPAATPAFSDLLLHDMGPGLADPGAAHLERAREWRTPPLLGLGQAARGGGVFLHDGRAGTLLEAILWHDGEAAPARDRLRALPPEDRAALIRYLETL